MDSEYIEQRDGRLYLTGTRIFVRNVADVVQSGVDIPDLAQQWNVDEEALHEALDVYEERQDEIEERREQERAGELFGSSGQATANEGAD